MSLSEQMVPTKTTFYSLSGPTGQYGTTENAQQSTHQQENVTRPVKCARPLDRLDHFSRTNPSHRRTNRIQPAASASLGLIQHLASIL